MPLSTSFSQNMSLNIFKINWILFVATILFVCCSYSQCKPTDAEQLTEHQLIDGYYPAFFYGDELVERAAPRLGRASPRFGRASPRLGRRTPAYVLSRLNHAGRYYIGDDDAMNDYAFEIDSAINDKRAAPRLGRRSV